MAIGHGLELGRVLAGAARRAARFHAGRVRAAVPQLDAGQGIVFVDRVGHRRQVATSPSSHRRADRRCVSSDSGWIEQYSVFIAAQPPSAFIDRCAAWKPRPVRPGADAVRHLVEAVLQQLRPDLDRLEQHIVFRPLGHRCIERHFLRSLLCPLTRADISCSLPGTRAETRWPSLNISYTVRYDRSFGPMCCFIVNKVSLKAKPAEPIATA